MQRIIIPNVCEEEFIGGSFNHLVRVVEQTRQTTMSDKVVWDFRNVTFLHPFFLAPLAIYKQQSQSDLCCEKHLIANAVLPERNPFRPHVAF